MNIKEISVFKDRKLQISQYEPYGFGYGAKAEILEGEDIKQAYQELEKFVDERIDTQTAIWKQPKKVAGQMSQERDLERQLSGKLF